MSAEKLAEAVTKMETELAMTETNIVTLTAAADETLAVIAADELTGEITTERADKLRADAKAALEKERARLGKLRAALPELRQRLADGRESERLRAGERQRATLHDAVKSRDRAVRQLAARVREAATAGREVERHRAVVEAELERLSELLMPGETIGVDLDESGWPETAELQRLLAGGARQPEAEQQRKLEQVMQDGARRDGEALGWFRRHANPLTLAGLSPHLHERAGVILREVEAERAQERARIEKTLLAREVERV